MDRHPPSDLHLRWELKKISPIMIEKLLQHGGGPLPYDAKSRSRCTINALTERKMLLFTVRGTEATAYGNRAIEMIVADMMKIDESVAPDLAPAEAEGELQCQSH